MGTGQIKRVGIAGAGTMGAGIAQVCAQAGYQVILYDILAENLEKAKQGIQKSLDFLLNKGKIDREGLNSAMDAISYTQRVEELKAEIIIEAIVEKLDIKIALFKQLIKINPADTIYASNTSSIPITQIAAGLDLPEQVLGIHFFNPAQIMKLVEVIQGAKTNKDVLNTAVSFVESLSKTAVIAADSPGFIVNRIARLYYVESLKILEENAAGMENIDSILESSGFKMGPFRLMDLIGVDTNYAVTESQFQLFNYEARFRPSRIQKQKVEAGLHGRKTKGGFYTYE